jgi:hypothetical protein
VSAKHRAGFITIEYRWLFNTLMQARGNHKALA